MTDDPEDILRYGFSSGWLAQTRYEESFKTALNDEFLPIAEAFSGNMQRVRNLGALVPEVAIWTRNLQRIMAFAKYRLNLPHELPERIRGAAKPSDELLEEYQRAYREWYPNNLNPSAAWEDGCDIVKSFVTDRIHHGLGLETLMSALLTETWAAVEAVLGDLFIRALDLAPDPLALSLLNDEKTIPVETLRRYSFDISGSMGSALASAKRLDFSSISSIEKAYRKAFSNENPGEIFDLYSPTVQHLEAIRNLYAHRSGKVDETFLRRVKNSKMLPNYEVGQPFELNGDLVSHYMGHAIDLATDIYMFVDQCVFAYRDKSK